MLHLSTDIALCGVRGLQSLTAPQRRDTVFCYKDLGYICLTFAKTRMYLMRNAVTPSTPLPKSVGKAGQEA